MALTSCRRKSEDDLEKTYQAATSQFERGELLLASEAAERNVSELQGTRPDWAFRFRVLQGEVLLWRGLPKDALTALEPDPPAGMESDEAATRRYVVLGLTHSLLRQFDQAEQYVAQADQAASTSHPDLLGYVALTRGTLALLRGEQDVGADNFRRALEIARRLHQNFLQASALGNLGVLATRQGHYDEAIDYYNASLRVTRVLQNKTLEAKTLGNLGWNYQKMGDLERALSLSDEAMTGASRLGQLKDEQIWLTNIGLIYFDRRDFARARESFSRSLEVARKLDNKSAIAISLNNLALMAIKQGQFADAGKFNDAALAIKIANHDRASELYSILNQALIETGTGQIQKAESHLKEVIRDSDQDASLRWQAQAELANTYTVGKQFADAERQFRVAMNTVDEARAALHKEEYRLSFLNTATEFYNSYVDFLVQQGRVEDALAIVEHSRARTLAEGLGIQPAALGSTSLSAKSVAKKENSVILSYRVKPRRSYLWAITSSKIELFALPAEDEVDAAVKSYRQALSGPRDLLESGNEAGKKLYQMLVAPAEKLIAAPSQIVIIPDGPLHELNFETLLVPGTRPHYWIDDVTIRNASSLALLRGPGTEPQVASKPNILLIGNPAATEFPSLPQAGEEIREVSTHFDAGRQTVLEGASATPAAYLGSDPGRFSYIHFVAHGTASRLSPLDSAVVLSPNGDSYKLYARDIVEKPLHAKLVTISACYGSGNRSYLGEGLVGLSWAFQRAGARNVVAALWEANDVSTPKLMDAMYDAISRGHDPATALREAKLAMLHSNNVFRRPFYWAPFQLYVGSGLKAASSSRRKLN